ncbi:phage tail sheath subtilisin-like domain-containing protein [Ideonella sp. YS5]|uniref:phage tail sheath family protein n=1 Tax=Ideonella sp. YS5 TaxID=3453714 RepID=UPI003EF012BC
MSRLSYATPGIYTELMPSARQPIFGVGTSTAAFIGLVPEKIWVPVPNPDYDPVLTRKIAEARNNALAGKSDEEMAGVLEDMNRRVDEKKVQEGDRQRALTNARAALRQAQTAFENATNRNRRAALEAAIPPAEQAVASAMNKLASATREREIVAGQLEEIKQMLARRGQPVDASPPAPAIALAPAPDAAPEAEPSAAAAEAPVVDAVPAPALPASPPAPVPTGTGNGDRPSIEKEDVAYQDSEPEKSWQEPSPLRPYYFEQRSVNADSMAVKLCTNFSEYVQLFGDFSGFEIEPENPGEKPELRRFKPLHPGHHKLTHAVYGFFANGGTAAYVARISRIDQLTALLEKLESNEEVAILAAPGLPKLASVWEQLESYCESDDRVNVFAVLDSSLVLNDGESNNFSVDRLQYQDTGDESDLPRKCAHAAYYAPNIEVSCPAKLLQDSDPARGVPPKQAGRCCVPPSGHVAGIYARTDQERGVHKAPANAIVRGAVGVKYHVSKQKQELLNPQGVNCIRPFDAAMTVWGARTVGGQKNADLMYVNVVRFLGFLRKSIEQGTQWAVFEPNDARLWARIVLNITSFLTVVWRNGALFGVTQEEAFYVRCDEELNPQSVRDLGQVITEIGVAIVRPAEFVIFRIAQFSAEDQR